MATPKKRSILDEHLSRIPRESLSIRGRVTSTRQKCCSYGLRRFIFTYIPILQTIYSYNIKSYLVNDMLSGISVGMASIPQAMGYASLIPVPLEYGLYSIIFPPLVYSLFTTSIHSSSSINSGGTVFIRDAIQSLGLSETPPNATEEEIAVALETRLQAIYALTFISGITIILAMTFKLTVLMKFNNEPHMSAMFAATMMLLLVNQLPHVLGIKIDSHTGYMQVLTTFIDICEHLPDSNIATVVISIVSFIIIALVKVLINERYSKTLPAPVPIDIMVLVSSTLISSLWDWEGKFDVAVIGELTSTIPTPQLPVNNLWTDYVKDGIYIGLLSFIGKVLLQIASTLLERRMMIQLAFIGHYLCLVYHVPAPPTPPSIPTSKYAVIHTMLKGYECTSTSMLDGMDQGALKCIKFRYNIFCHISHSRIQNSNQITNNIVKSRQ